jgi:hypothetical protein
MSLDCTSEKSLDHEPAPPGSRTSKIQTQQYFINLGCYFSEWFRNSLRFFSRAKRNANGTVDDFLVDQNVYSTSTTGWY